MADISTMTLLDGSSVNIKDSVARGALTGKADLDENGKVLSSQLPSYVDDVLEYAGRDSAFPLTGESGKIYVDTLTNKTYRWSGTDYVEISESLAIGTTSSSAFRGDYGQTAYTHAVTNKGSAYANGLYKITTNSEGHVTSATAVVKSDITDLGIPDSNTTYSDFSGAYGTNAGESGLVPAPTATDNGKYLKGDGTWSDVDALPVVTSSDNGKILEVSNGAWSVGNEKIDKKYNSNDFASIDFGLNFYGNYVWTDGENIYYSYGNDISYMHYVLNKSTLTWEEKTWSGIQSFVGSCIWTDGENIYYSYESNQYVLDKSTSTWSEKTWNGLTEFTKYYIWSDGENIYYSHGSQQYILDKSTSTWSTKTWATTLTPIVAIDGGNVWTDGENIYYNENRPSVVSYVLDKSTSIWSEKTWNGYTSLDGSGIWTDGKNIYYSGYDQLYRVYVDYVLDKSTSTWSEKTWTGLTHVDCSYLWTDGENIYYSDHTNHYKLNLFDKRILLGQNGEFESVDATGIVLPSVTNSDNDKVLVVKQGHWQKENLATFSYNSNSNSLEVAF